MLRSPTTQPPFYILIFNTYHDYNKNLNGPLATHLVPLSIQRYSTSSPLSSSTSTTTTATTGGWHWGFPNSHHLNHNRTISPTSSSSSPSSQSRSHSRSQSQSHSQSTPSRLASTLRRSSLALLLRRRPSKIDLALSEERSRADSDVVERQGLGLMEPRPVDPLIMGTEDVTGERPSRSRLSQPVFVMGGIEEVMEGKA